MTEAGWEVTLLDGLEPDLGAIEQQKEDRHMLEQIQAALEDAQCMWCFDHGPSSGSGELVLIHVGCLEELEEAHRQLHPHHRRR